MFLSAILIIYRYTYIPECSNCYQIILMTRGNSVSLAFQLCSTFKSLVISCSSGSELCIYGIYLVFQAVGCGILRGMGRQQLGTAVMSIAYGTGLATGIPALFLSDLGIIGKTLITFFINVMIYVLMLDG